MTDLGDILVVVGTALGVGSLIVIGLEAVSVGQIERPRPSRPSDWSDADPRTAEPAKNVFHNGTINRKAG